MQCAMHSVQYAVRGVQCAVCSVLCGERSLQCVVFGVQFMFVQCAVLVCNEQSGEVTPAIQVSRPGPDGKLNH